MRAVDGLKDYHNSAHGATHVHEAVLEYNLCEEGKGDNATLGTSELGNFPAPQRGNGVQNVYMPGASV